jgi:hypothetical protein
VPLKRPFPPKKSSKDGKEDDATKEKNWMDGQPVPCGTMISLRVHWEVEFPAHPRDGHGSNRQTVQNGTAPSV